MSKNCHLLMHKYEDRYKKRISYKYPVVIRIDGIGTGILNVDTMDSKYISAMSYATKKTIAQIKTSENYLTAYLQSDEVSIIIEPVEGMGKFMEERHRDTQKIVSAVSSIFTMNFNRIYKKKELYFDVRAFNVPKSQIQTMLIWRQRAAINYVVQYYAKKHVPYDKRKEIKLKALISLFKDYGFIWENIKDNEKNGLIIENGMEFPAPVMKYEPNLKTVKEYIGYLREIARKQQTREERNNETHL